MKVVLITDRVVDCACGAKDDDGERMLACEVWQHGRCVRIPDNQEMPPPTIYDCLGVNTLMLTGAHNSGPELMRPARPRSWPRPCSVVMKPA